MVSQLPPCPYLSDGSLILLSLIRAGLGPGRPAFRVLIQGPWCCDQKRWESSLETGCPKIHSLPSGPHLFQEPIKHLKPVGQVSIILSFALWIGKGMSQIGPLLSVSSSRVEDPSRNECHNLPLASGATCETCWTPPPPQELEIRGSQRSKFWKQEVSFCTHNFLPHLWPWQAAEGRRIGTEACFT